MLIEWAYMVWDEHTAGKYGRNIKKTASDPMHFQFSESPLFNEWHSFLSRSFRFTKCHLNDENSVTTDNTIVWDF